ncbi:MAG: lysophospholipid acyltransferase family protein [Flavobacteriaceae bacterium]
MQLLVYLLAYPFLWMISVLPQPVFYFFSDLFFVLLYHLAGYRKKVVYDNLKLTFPDKSDEEIRTIRKRFYRHFCDMLLETVKTMNLSAEEVAKRYKIVNMEVLLELEKDRNALMVCSHYANWEWSISINNYISSRGYAVYQKIGNDYFDRLIKRIRGRWNTTLITQPETVKTILRNEQSNIKGVYGMVSDQSPMVGKAQYWKEFMGVKVPIFNGPETIARRLDLAVVFLKITKLKRGHYEAQFIPITASGKHTQENEITDRFLELTENQIKERPELYLWTHRRWKHRNKVPTNA